jgi:hypothetical protein
MATNQCLTAEKAHDPEEGEALAVVLWPVFQEPYMLVVV